ncbi:MAG TPA: tRNA cyclic N6-threonylcarbamoyladenosine(37) synthase TcdA [Peptococcaceae bacterium]|nr:MAG: UBA/THIF-type NAD/FAD binding fold protein [Moorella sp. 60_41]HBT47342.1 tRNA cyclic N6-threonylcarbamoyladenosine(37) synthase TcdA [Peptococcaceae bacterium]
MEETFTARTELLIGVEGLDKLSRARVAVIGLGGVGSFAAEALARAGVGYLELVDYDYIVPSNINRQLHALHSTVGQPKVLVMARRLQDINPRLMVVPRQERYTPDTGRLFVRPDLDYLVDAIDTVQDKADLLARAYNSGIRIVSSMGAGNRLDPTALEVADISATRGCPLARAVRRHLRRRGIQGGIKVVYSREALRKNSGGASQGRRPPGSISFVPSVVGLILASIVVRELLE